MTAAASKPCSRESRYTSEPCTRRILSRCFGARRSSLSRDSARSSARPGRGSACSRRVRGGSLRPYTREARTTREGMLRTAAGNSCKTCFQGQLGRREVGFPLASTGQGGVEPARKYNREQRRRDVRSIVDVLILSTAFAATATDHSDRVDVEQNGRGTGVVRSLRVEDRGVTERELPCMHTVRMLVQQEAKVGGRPLGRSDGQEHVLVRSGGAVVQYRRKHEFCRQVDVFWNESVSHRRLVLPLAVPSQWHVKWCCTTLTCSRKDL
jgi:hypothetical protein